MRVRLWFIASCVVLAVLLPGCSGSPTRGRLHASQIPAYQRPPWNLRRQTRKSRKIATSEARWAPRRTPLVPDQAGDRSESTIFSFGTAFRIGPFVDLANDVPFVGGLVRVPVFHQRQHVAERPPLIGMHVTGLAAAIAANRR